MELKLMSTAICRTPVFCSADLLEKRWPEVKELIRESSPEFYRIVETMDYEQLKAAGDKINFSVWKYFNRAKFRATPFGGMAAITLLPVAAGLGNLVIEGLLMKHCFTDWSENETVPDFSEAQWFRANTTCYKIGNELRYTRLVGTQFELATVPLLPELETLLFVCRDIATRQDIYPVMAGLHNMHERVTTDLIDQMLVKQLLLSERSPNITGPDCFDRLKIGRTKAPYIIAERNLYSGALDPAMLNVMPEYFKFLKDHFPIKADGDVESFKNRFRRKFDLKVVPLCLAIDPETGVGYGELEAIPHELSKSDPLGMLFTNSTQEPQLDYTEVHRFLLNNMTKGGTIQLENFKGKPLENTALFPNTFSAIINFWKGIPVIESAGGCTANSLLGRFTLIDGDAYTLGKEIAAIEENANPQVLFFDIAYQAEKTIDNVNRRRSLYQSELPIVCWSCHDTPLSLDDILIMVREGEIILWSEKHQKRLVPRIASAYNYSRSDLPVYRFLCDLQHQGLYSDMSFRLQRFFPGLDYYPRVMYKSIVVSAARWKVNFPGTDLPGLKKWLTENSIDFHFKSGHADQTLCFDPRSDSDLDLFLMYCRQNYGREVYITEALFGDVIVDRQAGLRIPQYIVNFSHEQRVYHDYGPPPVAGGETISPPGSEWLFYEVYCHPARANQVLQMIRQFTVTYKAYVKHWFFIRYNDPSAHIRLRLKLKDVAYIGFLMGEIKLTLQELLENGLITDIQLKTYIPEIIRYGRERMLLVEQVFYVDSVYTLNLLSHRSDALEFYTPTLKFMYQLLELANLEDQIGFVSAVADKFSAEFRIDTEGYKRINKSFEQMKANTALEHVPLSRLYSIAFLKVISCCKAGEKEHMVADIIHMHINRLFSIDQRKHEAILYHYLLKLLKARRFRSAVVQAP